MIPSSKEVYLKIFLFILCFHRIDMLNENVSAKNNTEVINENLSENIQKIIKSVTSQNESHHDSGDNVMLTIKNDTNSDKDHIDRNQHNILSEDMSFILKQIRSGIKKIDNTECVEHLINAIDGFGQRKQWAIAMFDSSVKIPTGVEYGVTYQFGNFDQCMDITTDKIADGVAIKPKYCLADVVVEGYNVRSMASRHYVETNSTLVHWGVCIPESCSSRDVELYLSIATGYQNISVTTDKCTVNEPLRIGTGDIIFASVLISFALMVLVSTCYHVFLIYRPIPLKGRSNGCFEMITKSFSIVENLHKMGKPSSDELGLGCVNGIKALSMLLIVASHALLFMVGGPVQNTEFYESQSTQLQNAVLLNSPLLVDSFLLLSGFLFTRLIMLELNKRKGQVNFLLLYIFRYIRLTPAYFAMIMMYLTWLPKLGSGPLWNSRIGIERERCEESWWLNILYINNYIGSYKICMFQSWYLATDTQLFILAPILLYPLWRWRRVGSVILGAAVVISTIFPFAWTSIHKLDPTFLAFQDEVQDLATNEFFVTSYVKTHMRATAYLFGILTGYLVHVMQEKEIRLSKFQSLFLWLVSLAVGGLSMFTVTIFYHKGYEFSNLENSLYAGLHRLGWSIFTSWLLLSCVMGYAGPLKSFFTSRALAPISRLTYCAYLSNGLVELYQAGTLRTPKYMSVINLFGETLSHLCLTFIAALVLCLLFESPIHGIEKIFLRRDAQKQKKQEQTPSTSEESA